ncbi:hypothetical protein CK203_110956 [Vitis vinifera]|uniref:Ubiquitin-like protease family profile domain-containing protein n=1 Tax=Vitis vinifera TaxID=29760 RepID=A0A438CCQ3_VITVI|nr:hypothetical protein CK203_110956 [Vitis vinifera]
MLLHYVLAAVDQTRILQSVAQTHCTTLNMNQASSDCKSPFVAQCVKQFPKIPHADRVVVNYALVEIGDPSEILCEIYGMYITREEMSYLNVGRWVNLVIVAIMSRMLNGQQTPPARAHYFDPSFSVVLCNLKANATSQVIMDRCRMYLDADILGRDLGICDMAGNNISASMRRLSMAIHKALLVHRIHMDLDVSTFVHVQPHLVQKLNRYDCGILALKFMEF